MKKRPSFDEAKARTPKSEARRREINLMRDMEALVDIADEEEFKEKLAERFDLFPGNPRFEKVLATWRELRRGKYYPF